MTKRRLYFINAVVEWCFFLAAKAAQIKRCIVTSILFEAASRMLGSLHR